MKKKQYKRSSKDRIVAGVLGGVADYYNQDTTLVRIFFLLVLCATGFMPAILIYFLTIIIVPSEKKPVLKRKSKKL